MGPLLEATELSKALIEAGNNLVKPCSSTDATLSLLDEIGSLLSTVEQDPIASVQSALLPSMKALVSADLLRNPDSDVRVFVVSCLTDIMRITAPEAPYNDDQMKDIFQVTVEAFGKLADASCRSYKKVEVILETFSKVKLSLVMLDLECDDLVLELFRQFLEIISPHHPQRVTLSMETVMITVIDEIEEVSMDLLEILLTAVKKESQDVAPTSSGLVERVLRSCARRLQPCIMKALKFKGTSLDMYSPIVLSICHSESAATQAHNVVNAKEIEAVEKISEKQVPSGSLEDNPEEVYSLKTSSDNKMQGEDPSSPGKLTAKKASLPTKAGQTSKSSGKSRRGSRKRNRTKMEETSNDVGSIAPPTSKKRIVKKDESEEEENCTVSDGIKNTKSSKKERAQNGVVKTSAKKPVSETKIAKTSGKKSVNSDAKKKNSEGVSMDTPIHRASKSEKKNPRATTSSTKKNEQTPKSNSKKKRTSREEVESNTNELGEELVGKKVNVWWPIDMKFYEGVIDSYSSSKKTHLVSYCDGDAEELNLKKERFEIIQDTCEDEEIDPLESVPLCDFIQKQKVKKSKNCKSLKQLNGEPGRTKGRTAEKQKVARAMHQESENDCDEKEDPETKGEESLKSGEVNAASECMEEHHDLTENQNTETDGEEEQKSAKGPNAEPETDGKEHKVAKETVVEPESNEKEQKPIKETNVEPKTGDEEYKVAQEPAAESKTDEEEQAKETNAELGTDEKEQKPLKETNVEPKTEGEERKSVKEPDEESETKEEEKESAKEQTCSDKID